jgi:hypothetical protein
VYVTHLSQVPGEEAQVDRVDALHEQRVREGDVVLAGGGPRVARHAHLRVLVLLMMGVMMMMMMMMMMMVVVMMMVVMMMMMMGKHTYNTTQHKSNR